MQTTKELIAKLQTKAKGAFLAGIVVGFARRTEFVWVNSADPLGNLGNQQAVRKELILDEINQQLDSLAS